MGRYSQSSLPEEVHPPKIEDFDPCDPYFDYEPVKSCWLHVFKKDGQLLAEFEFHDHSHHQETEACLALDLDVDSMRGLNSMLMTDGNFGKALHQNTLNDLATQIVRQLEYLKEQNATS